MEHLNLKKFNYDSIKLFKISINLLIFFSNNFIEFIFTKLFFEDFLAGITLNEK